MNRYEAVIFDLDGTLLDTLQDLADAMNGALQATGNPTHPADAYKYFVGDGVYEALKRALPGDNPKDELIQKCVNIARENYHRCWAEKTKPYPGIPELLDAIVSHGMKMAVLSNKPDDFTKMMVEKLLDRWQFDMALGEGPVPKKPDTQGAFLIAKELSIDPQKCLYVGDTNTDMQTAKAAGMFAVGCLWGFRTKEELEQNGADAIVETPQQIIEML